MTRRRWPRILGYVLGSLLLLVVALYVFASSRVSSALSQRYTVPAAALMPPDSMSMARGAHLAQVLGCRHCHGGDLGGRLLDDAPPLRVEPINLTRGTGGIGAQLTPAVFEGALRHGVGHDGRGLVVMPDYAAMTDADVVALHAYVSSVAPVNGARQGVVVKPLGKMIFGLTGLPDFDPERFERTLTFEARPPTGPTPEHGRYLARLTCMHCHGADLKGGEPGPPGSPAPPSLDAASRWSEEQFAAALQEGKRPSGPVLDSTFMPWDAFRHFTDEEILAISTHLKQTFGAASAASR